MAIENTGTAFAYSANLGSRPSVYSICGFVYCAAAVSGSAVTQPITLGDTAYYPNDHGDLAYVWDQTYGPAQKSGSIHQAGTSYVSGSGTFTQAQWHHVAVGYTGSQMKTYIDGTLTSTVSASVTAASPADWVFNLFSNNGSNGLANWTGRLAHCAAFKVALTALQVGSLAKGFSPRIVCPSGLSNYVPGMSDARSFCKGAMTTSGTLGKQPHPRVFGF